MNGPNAILCVDDEAIILLALKNELRRAFKNRFIYETAQAADQALLLIDQLKERGVEVILVISDWLMPGIKGDEFLAIVRSRYPETKSVMITGHADEDVITEAIGSGNCIAVVRKPWRSEELLKTIEGILDASACA